MPCLMPCSMLLPFPSPVLFCCWVPGWWAWWGLVYARTGPLFF